MSPGIHVRLPLRLLLRSSRSSPLVFLLPSILHSFTHTDTEADSHEHIRTDGADLQSVTETHKCSSALLREERKLAERGSAAPQQREQETRAQQSARHTYARNTHTQTHQDIKKRMKLRVKRQGGTRKPEFTEERKKRGRRLQGRPGRCGRCSPQTGKQRDSLARAVSLKHGDDRESERRERGGGVAVYPWFQRRLKR